LQLGGRENDLQRRDFLQRSATAALTAALPAAAAADPIAAPVVPPVDGAWRNVEVVTDVEIWPQDVPARVWLPFPLYGDTEWQRALDVRWSGNPATSGIYRD